MNLFYTLIALLSLLAIVVLLKPLFGKNTASMPNAEAMETLAEALEAKQQGKIDDEKLQAVRDDIAKQYLAHLEQQTHTQKPTGLLLPLFLLILLPAMAYISYQATGTPEALVFQDRNERLQQLNALEPESALAPLQAFVAEYPDFVDGWILLARNQATLGNYPQAVEAYNKALNILPDEPIILVETAESMLFSSNERRFSDESIVLLDRAISFDSRNQKARWLRGMAAFQDQDWLSAKENWQQLMNDLPESSPVATAVQEQLNQVLAELGEETHTMQAPGPGQIMLEIDLAGELESIDLKGHTLFVYARASQGPPMPLAVKRLEEFNFPLQLELTDDDSMMPQLTLSSVADITVGARISKSGNALPESGDYQAMEVAGIKLGNQQARLLIQEQVP